MKRFSTCQISMIVIQSFVTLVQSVLTGSSAEEKDAQSLGAPVISQATAAKKLINEMYFVMPEHCPRLTDDKSNVHDVGAQMGYAGKGDAYSKYGHLLNYGRVWAYDSGFALSQAVASMDSSADARARWLLQNGQFMQNPDQPDLEIFAGWPFSMNQISFGDNWKDCRFVTGANAHALHGLGLYMTSSLFKNLDKTEQLVYFDFFADALSGILYHIESTGPNAGLVTAGWTVNALDDHEQTDYTVDELLDKLGYGLPQNLEGYSKPIQRIRAKNVELEHCVAVLMLLNQTIVDFDLLLKEGSRYTKTELKDLRNQLRDMLFAKLYQTESHEFIAGLTAEGSPTLNRRVGIAAWLVLAMPLKELSVAHVVNLANNLAHTVQHFTHEFNIEGKTYYAVHCDVGELKQSSDSISSSQVKVLDIEATAGLICGLLSFAEYYPEVASEFSFLDTAHKLLAGFHHFIHDHGFVYSSDALKDGDASLQATVSALWYLRTQLLFGNESIVVHR